MNGRVIEAQENAVASAALIERAARAEQSADRYRLLADSAQRRVARVLSLCESMAQLYNDNRDALAQLRAVRELHVQAVAAGSVNGPGSRCRHCRRPWPCDTAQIVNPKLRG